MAQKVAVTDDGCLSCGNTCRGNCAGGCNNTCKGDCRNGCGHACNYSCYPTCAHNCTGDCRNGCGHDCNRTCSPTCAHTCGNGSCKGNCTGTCKNGCGGNCKNGCGGCDNGCSSCTGTCSGGCLAGCSGKCYGTCNSACGNQCTNGATKNLETFAINTLNTIQQTELTFIINAIKYEVSRRKLTPTEISVVTGDLININKIQTIIEELKKVNSKTTITAPKEIGQKAYKDLFENIIRDLKAPWNEIIDPEMELLEKFE